MILRRQGFRNTTPIKRNKSRFIRILLVILIPLILTALPLLLIIPSAKEASQNGKSLVASYKNQNFDQIRKDIRATKNSIDRVAISLRIAFWIGLIPFIGGYYTDAKNLSLAAVEELKAAETLFDKIEPYKVELGFRGQPIAGPDRLSQSIKILEKSLPYLNLIEGNLKNASELVKDIDAGKYPEKYNNFEVRNQIDLLKNFIIGASLALSESRPALEITPSALGQPYSKNYLFLFQNDKEIRPTGGFLTAYAFMSIEKGQVSTSISDDIYRLDEKLLTVCQSKICPLTPPAPIVKYLPEVSGKPRSAWSMRDSNMSPHLPKSAEEFERMYKLLGEGLPYDGIIFIDSQVVEELIEVTGPVEVLGTTYSAEVDKRCNCPNVIYELESYAEIAAKGEKDRKAILGVLMQQILARSLGADVEKLPKLIETVIRLANHKHIMFYMHDQKVQSALLDLNWVGEIKSFDGDYLHINDSNFAGGKSNLYVEQSVTQEINIQKDGTVKKKITIEYKNPQPFNIWLNGINRDYVRLYVPKGSKLVSSKGSEVAVTTIEDDLGKTVFEAFIQVRPQNSRKLEIEFTSPFKPKSEYRLLIQKQPGAKDFHYKIKLNGKQLADFKLDMDKEFKFNF